MRPSALITHVKHGKVYIIISTMKASVYYMGPLMSIFTILWYEVVVSLQTGPAVEH
jgi:hypothetical protein